MEYCYLFWDGWDTVEPQFGVKNDDDNDQWGYGPWVSADHPDLFKKNCKSIAKTSVLWLCDQTLELITLYRISNKEALISLLLREFTLNI